MSLKRTISHLSKKSKSKEDLDYIWVPNDKFPQNLTFNLIKYF